MSQLKYIGLKCHCNHWFSKHLGGDQMALKGHHMHWPWLPEYGALINLTLYTDLGVKH